MDAEAAAHCRGDGDVEAAVSDDTAALVASPSGAPPPQRALRPSLKKASASAHRTAKRVRFSDHVGVRLIDSEDEEPGGVSPLRFQRLLGAAPEEGWEGSEDEGSFSVDDAALAGERSGDEAAKAGPSSVRQVRPELRSSVQASLNGPRHETHSPTIFVYIMVGEVSASHRCHSACMQRPGMAPMVLDANGAVAPLHCQAQTPTAPRIGHTSLVCAECDACSNR